MKNLTKAKTPQYRCENCYRSCWSEFDACQCGNGGKKFKEKTFRRDLMADVLEKIQDQLKRLGDDEEG